MQGDLPVNRGEQPRGRWVVGLEDRPLLRLGGLLGLLEAVPVAGQRPDLSQQRRRRGQRAPLRVFVAQGAGQNECIEPVVFDRGDAVALPGSGGDAWRHREHGVALGLQVLDEHPFGALDRDRQGFPVLVQRGVEFGSGLSVTG